MKNSSNNNIPRIEVNQLEDYLFGDWRHEERNLYHTFHIAKAETYKNFIKLPILPHRRTNYYFIFLTKGSSKRSKNLNHYEIGEYDFYSMPANQISSIDFMSDDVEGYYCHFMPEIFNQPQLKVDIERDFPFFNISSNPVVKINEVDRILQMLELIQTEYEKNETKRSNIIAFHLTALLNEVNFEYGVHSAKSTNAAYTITQEYKLLLSEDLTMHYRVVDFARTMEITPNHLNKCVKEVTGKSAHQIFSDMRILQSKVMLKQSKLSVKEIAYIIGEFESSDFIQFFKKNTGVTPKEYRNQQG